MSRRLIAICAALILAGSAVWVIGFNDSGDRTQADLPVPPFPPRIAEGDAYETCLKTLATDRDGAAAIVDATPTDMTDGTLHCRGLALIAIGRPDEGADVLEQLSVHSSVPALGRALVLGQAGQARLMVAQADRALADASMALTLSPGDTDLFIMRASAAGMLGRFQNAVDDLDQALRLDPVRADAFVARAVAQRQLNRLDLAQADVTQALTLDPDDADALLERGILRQRMGDTTGARLDWEHAQGIDPNSTTADLAAQNLSLLEAGPRQQ